MMNSDVVITPATWLQSGRFYHHGQHDIFFKSAGSGPETILLIHGFPTASWDWLKLWPTLSKKYRVVALDLLGFGFSAKPQKHTYSFHEQADIIEGLLEDLDIASCHVLAHDYGDTVAQELIARQLEGQLKFQLTTVCLLNGGIFPEAHSRRTIQKLLLSPIGFIVSAMATKGTLRKNFHNIFGPDTPPTSAEIDGFWQLLTHNNGRRVIHKVSQYLKEREQYRARWAGALQRCPVPLRLINGNSDPISGRQMVARFEELVDQADTISLPTIGHYPQTEAPELVLQHFLAFIASGEEE
jgi:pimeloyl-ACP methyl ester carboxylesterase